MCITLFWIRVQLVVLDHHVVLRCLDHLGDLHLGLALACSTKFQNHHQNSQRQKFYAAFWSDKILSHLNICVVDADKLIARFESSFFSGGCVVKHLKKINIY